MIIDAALYKAGHRLPAPFDLKEAARASQATDTFCWIGLFEPTEDEFEAAATEFDLHELAVEDAIHAHQRPKLDLYDDTLFVVLKPAGYDDASETVTLGEILVFLSDDFVVAVRHGEASRLVDVRRRLEDTPEDLAMGPGAVLLEILDKVVDDYVVVLDGLEADIRQVEEEVFSERAEWPTERIYRLKRQVLHFRQATQPLLDPIDRMVRGRFPAIHPELREYFRDVHDHLTRVVERVTAAADLLTSILDANLTQVSVRQNEDMRKISAWVAVAAVPTLLAGIWGMNFDLMPELDEWWGYPAALLVMASISTFLYRRFKRSGWL
jgi:magnesium transporter